MFPAWACSGNLLGAVLDFRAGCYVSDPAQQDLRAEVMLEVKVLLNLKMLHHFRLGWSDVGVEVAMLRVFGVGFHNDQLEVDEMKVVATRVGQECPVRVCPGCSCPEYVYALLEQILQ